MGLFRSDPMAFFDLVMPRESAWEIMNELGETSALQFVDLNEEEQAFNRPYSGYIKRCEEMEFKLQTIELAMARFGKKINRCDNTKVFLKNLRDFLATRSKAEQTYLDDLESEIEERLASLNEQIRSYDSLVEKYNHLLEYIHVLAKTAPYFGHDALIQAQNIGGDMENKQFENMPSRDLKFCYIAGVIDREDSQRFRRMLFRATLGMVWSVLIDIEPTAEERGRGKHNEMISDSKGQKKNKTVFLIAYPGGNGDFLQNKLNKIADSFGASKYGIPENANNFMMKLKEINEQKEDAWRVVEVTKNHIDMVLESLSQPRKQTSTWSLIEDFRLFLAKEKAIYHNLNMLSLQNTIYHGKCWCPEAREETVREALMGLTKRRPHLAGAQLQRIEPPKNKAPPTYIRTNEFSEPFQEIVNTYGAPRYREVNPGLFTIATFPFLFGVMFGDMGHGAILLLFGLYLCFRKDDLEREKSSLAGLLSGRYLIAMMGFFAFYCGFIYNDFMAMPWNFFGSCYTTSGSIVTRKEDCVYPFGLDPTWYHKTNELTFFNSFKMKLSVIIGVSQMVMGTMLKMFNAIFFKSKLDFFFEWVPQICFLLSTFGYMIMLIFFKWATHYEDTSRAPSIINVFINLMLKVGGFDPKKDGQPFYGDADGSTQSAVQRVLLVIVVIAVPMMLLPKPIILAQQHKKKTQEAHHHHHLQQNPMEEQDNKKKPLLQDHQDEEEIAYNKEDGEKRKMTHMSIEHPPKKKHVEEEEGEHGEGFGDLFVHQLIETIEFVLGSVSHTASYLRLWALSLAHSQLAKVFFENTMKGAIISGNPISTFIGFAIFIMVTFGVLLCMDVMECFLHALRLHWVEFQSKFFKADGHLFQPFSFDRSLKNEIKA